MVTRTNLIAVIFTILGASGVAPLTPGTPAAAQTAEPEQGETVNTRTATFDVENMTCALCPITVRKAMAAVPGVSKVEVDFESKTATVAFDPAAASSADIAAASTNAGYPAVPVTDDPE